MIPLWLTALATGRAVVFALIVWLAAGILLFQVGPYPSLIELGQGLDPLDERMGYSWQEAMIYLAVLGESGRGLYRVFLVADMGNALLIAATFTLLFTFLVDKLKLGQSAIALLALLPSVVGVLDLIENTLLMIAIGQFSEVSRTVIGAASWSTQGKLGLGMVAFMTAGVGLLAWSVSTVRARRGPADPPSVDRG